METQYMSYENSISRADMMPLISQQEILLARMINDGMADEDTLFKLTQHLDFDNSNLFFVNDLARIGASCQWVGIPASILPRLKGVLRYVQVYRSMTMPWLCQSIQLLSDANIPVMLTGGIAVREGYCKTAPVHCWHFDIAVRKADFSSACRSLQEGQAKASPEAKLSVKLRVWSHPLPNGAGDETSLWDRARKQRFQNLEVFIPSAEDLLLYELEDRMADCFAEQPPQIIRMRWFYDGCRILSNSKLSLPDLAIRAEQLEMRYAAAALMPYFAESFPEIVNPDEVGRLFPRDLEYQQWSVCGKPRIYAELFEQERKI